MNGTIYMVTSDLSYVSHCYVKRQSLAWLPLDAHGTVMGILLTVNVVKTALVQNVILMQETC